MKLPVTTAPHSTRSLALSACALALATPALAGGGGANDPGEPAGLDALAATQEAESPSSLRSAFLDGRWWLSLRLRYEDVDQEGFTKDAHALTLRTVLGYETADWHGFSALLEFEDVSAIPDSSTYNSSTNGVTDRPLVPDPEGTEVNRATLRYRWDEQGSALVGRQRIILDNHRFVGNVGWRQNEQTFDAGSLQAGLPLELDLFYAYVDNVNRIFGEQSPVGDARMGSHLVHLEREFEGWGRLSLYDYYLDYDSAAALSTNSLGARFAGKHALGDDSAVTYAAEYARQSDVADNPLDVDVNYYVGELGAEFGILSAGLGWEVLGGDGMASFQTPLATLHKFNGWADKFVVATPADGLEDLYAQLGVRISKGRLQAIWHDFNADEGSDHYGSEIDLAFTWPLAKDVTLGLKYADYSADDFATDTRKAWVWLAASI